jgi:hypothetical protein
VRLRHRRHCRLAPSFGFVSYTFEEEGYSVHGHFTKNRGLVHLLFSSYLNSAELMFRSLRIFSATNLCACSLSTVPSRFAPEEVLTLWRIAFL